MGIHDLDFLKDSNQSQKNAAKETLGRENLRSTTIENLLSQNDDLMARLKVTLRRLSTLEIENQKLTEEVQRAQLSQTAVTDQMLVYKEKDKILRNKMDHLERDKERLAALSLSLEKTVQQLSSNLERHKKYQDKIKTQVKPYVTALKDYSSHLEQKIKVLEINLSQRETQVRELREQMGEITRNARFQVETHYNQIQSTIENYETQVQHLTEQVLALNLVESDLTDTKKRLNLALERKDELENEVVHLRRTKEEIRSEQGKEVERLQTRITELSRQNQKLGIEHADLQTRVLETEEGLKKFRSENENLREQLDSVRLMWSSRSEELEKAKTAMAALERLNLELSRAASKSLQDMTEGPPAN